MESLVHWKRKRDMYHDEEDEDDTEVREPRLVDAMDDCKFIMRDETNAKAMRSMKIKWW